MTPTLRNPAPRTHASPHGTVHLYEDNAGGLYLWRPYGQALGYSGLEAVDNPDGSYYDDAAALLQGDTDSWTVEPITNVDDRWTLVAEYDDGAVTIHDHLLGTAARNYLKADIAWARDAMAREA